MQGTGRYAIYVANYASGNIGPHALLEMDQAASDVPRGVVTLSDVAAQAGVNKLTGEELVWEDFGDTVFVFCRYMQHCVSSLCRGAGRCRRTNPEQGQVRRVLR